MMKFMKVLVVCWLMVSCVHSQGSLTSETPTIAPESTASPNPTPESTAPPNPTPESTAPPNPTPATTALPNPTPESTASPNPTPESTASPNPTPESTASPNPTPESTASPNPTPDSTASPNPTPATTASPNPTPESTAQPNPTPESTASPNPTPESTASPNPTPESTASPNPTPDSTASPNPTPETTASPNSTPEASTSPAPETPTPETPKPDPCLSNPCPDNSKCEQRFDGYTCVCRPGLVLQDEVCTSAKVFTGNLRIVQQAFEQDMEDKTSEVFKKTTADIVAELRTVLGTSKGYITSTVQKLSKGSVVADVENIYELSSDVTAEVVNKAVAKRAECSGCLFEKAKLEDTSLCDAADACDLLTTTCNDTGGVLSCDCKEGYVKTDFTDRSCSVCPSGYEAKDNKCEPCSFGYSGVNCKESYLLAVVVISCVLGALLLILLIILIVLCCKKSKKGSGSLAKSSPYIDMDFRNQAVPKIPRATHNNKGWEPSNLEMVESGSTRALVNPSNGMKQYNGGVAAYRTHGQVNPYYQPNEDQARRY
ncbi:mucin-13b [Engraulis encrasicolus]|uniref:mucin-13b n=1 Tax=Engraulis encrasicolus TaxID=184585 RepID=UPI002FCFB853